MEKERGKTGLRERWRRWRPATLYGFPVESGKDGRRPLAARAGQRGVAMIIAIMVVSMVLIFTVDMMITSSVALRLGVANRDNIKAEYMARSGFNLAVFLLSFDLGLDLMLFKSQKKLPSDGPEDMWGLFNGLPIGADTVEMAASTMEALDLSKVNDGKVIEQLRLFDGMFVTTITDEQSRINLNYCAKGRGSVCLELIKGLLSCPAEKEFLDRKKLTPEEVAAAIKDWVDEGDKAEAGAAYTDEGEPYAETASGGPKNAPFDSLDEVLQVAGWDEEMHRVFGPYMTVFPMQMKSEDKPRININSAPLAMMQCLYKNMSNECKVRATLRNNPTDTEGPVQAVAGLQSVHSRMSDFYCQSNKKQVNDRFTYRSDTYRVQVVGEVGGQSRTLEVVLKRMYDELDIRAKFKGSYKILYWKLI